MLKIENVYKTFHPGTINEKKALTGVELTLNEGDFVTVIGGNGAGKSTLLKAIINNELLSEGIGTEKFNIYKEGNPRIGYLKQVDFEDDNIT